MPYLSSAEKKKEDIRNDLIKKVKDDEKVLRDIKKEDRENKFRQRKDFVKRLELERIEAALNGVVLKAQEADRLQKNQLEQEEKLAVELSLIRRQEIVDEKLRLQLRESSHELKKFESQLRAAYAQKSLAAQLAEKEANKIEEELRDKKAYAVIERAVGRAEEQERAMMAAENEQKEKFRHSLQNQIIEKERLRQLEFMALMKEKKFGDEILKKIKEDEERDLKEKLIMQQKTKEEMHQFYTAKEVWKAKERLLMQQEDDKIKQINEEKEKAKEKGKLESILKAKIRDQISDNLLKQHKEMMKIVEEQDKLVSILVANESAEKEERKAKAEAEKEIAQKLEVKEAFMRDVEEKRRKKIEEKELDRQFARQIALKVEEEEKQEKEKKQKKREKELENLRYNMEAMKQNIQKRAEGLKLQQLMNSVEEQEEKRKAALIEEERIRMLREHAPKLIGYFPKGCLRPEDFEILRVAGTSPLPETCPLE